MSLVTLQSQFQQLAEGCIDFEGQRLTSMLLHYILVAFTVFSFTLGWAMQSLLMTLYTFLGGLALLTIIIVVPWPAYNKHPVAWLPPSSNRKPKAE